MRLITVLGLYRHPRTRELNIRVSLAVIHINIKEKQIEVGTDRYLGLYPILKKTHSPRHVDFYLVLLNLAQRTFEIGHWLFRVWIKF